MATIRELYEKFCRGDALTDKELDIARTFYRDLERRLIHCGPVFHLAWCEAARVVRVLDDYYDARNRKG